MCLIIHIPKGQKVAPWILDSAAMYNPDGVGIMRSGKAEKWLDIDTAEIVDLLRDSEDVDTAIHYRWATHGNVTIANVHPFVTKGKFQLMHNGILSEYTPDMKDKRDMSDSRLFVQKFVNPTIKRYGSVPNKLMRKEISGNAILMMDKHGAMKRYGNGWNEYHGCWFSNEYAWDCPNAWNANTWKRGGNSVVTPLYDMADDCWYDYIGSYGEVYNTPKVKNAYGDWKLGHSERTKIINELGMVSDLLPFNDCGVIAYDDWDIAADVLSGKCLVWDFLYDCTNATLISLYEDCINSGIIKSKPKKLRATI